MVNLPFFRSAIRSTDSLEPEVLQLSSEAPTHRNSEEEGKLRADEWLISAILREINQLKDLAQRCGLIRLGRES
jgi:hypothetical protein